jgi:hypothetical protein
MDRTSNGFRAKFEAYLGNYQRFGSYLNFYHEAFKILMKDVETTGGHVDRIAYPMLFIARHCLELGFKTNIRHFKKYSEKDDFTNSDSHNLKDLFHAFILHVRTTIKNLKDKHGIEVEPTEIKEFEQYCSELEKLTLYFDQVDKGSFSFRYPVDKKNKTVFKYDDRVNLLDIEELLNQGMVLLNHTADVFGKYTDYVDDIEKMYEDEMRSSYGEW